MKKTTQHFKRLKKISVLLIILLIALITIMTSFYAQDRLVQRSDGHFHDNVSATTKTLVKDVEKYNSLLYTARSFVTSSPQVSQQNWDSFFKSQNTVERYPGISSVIYIEIVPKTEKATFESRLRNSEYFGKNFAIKDSATVYSEYAVASLVSSENDVRNSLGFDNYSTDDRRAVYLQAAKSNQPTASRPLKLATGPLGFFIALPVYETRERIAGYVAISFRADDFTNALFESNLPLMASKIADTSSPGNPVLLYESENWSTTPEEITRTETVIFGSRNWELQFKAQRSYDYPLLNRTIPRLILVSGGLVLIILILGLISYQQHSKARSISKT